MLTVHFGGSKCSSETTRADISPHTIKLRENSSVDWWDILGIRTPNWINLWVRRFELMERSFVKENFVSPLTVQKTKRVCIISDD